MESTATTLRTDKPRRHINELVKKSINKYAELNIKRTEQIIKRFSDTRLRVKI